MALEKKYYVFAAKLECANNIKKKRNLALIEELTIEELNDIWPGWTHKDIVNNFLEIYKHIIKAEAKGIKRENAVVYTRELLKNSWMTKQLNTWFADGSLDEAEKEKVKDALFDVSIAW